MATWDEIKKRSIKEATFIVQTGSTVRKTAKKFYVSKSTVYKDVTERLECINPILAKKVRKVLDVNKAERSIRGSLATKKKYALKKVAK